MHTTLVKRERERERERERPLELNVMQGKIFVMFIKKQQLKEKGKPGFSFTSKAN
jgi:hypothetical protein